MVILIRGCECLVLLGNVVVVCYNQVGLVCHLRIGRAVRRHDGRLGRVRGFVSLRVARQSGGLTLADESSQGRKSV